MQSISYYQQVDIVPADQDVGMRRESELVGRCHNANNVLKKTTCECDAHRKTHMHARAWT